MPVNLEKKKATHRRWYNRNSEEYNERRKSRYQDDPDYAEKARERARAYKARKRLEKAKKNGGDSKS